MRDRLIILVLTLLLAGAILGGVRSARQQPVETVVEPVAAQAQPAANIYICLKGLICPTTTLTLLQRLPVTVRVSVSVPVTVTVRLPPVTVTDIIRLPPVVRTIIVPRTIFPPPLVQPGRVVTVRGLPGATKTVTVVVNREVVRNGTAAPVTREVRTTTSQKVSTGQATVTRGTIVPKKEKQVVHIPGGTVTKFQAVGIGLLALIALMAAGMLLLWLGFILGFRNAEKENISFLKALRDYAKRKPGQHEIG
jgi:hypothetical protein